MANTLRIPNINGQVFDRLVKEFTAAGMVTAPPSQHPDNTIRGEVGRDTGMGEIKIAYVYSPVDTTLVLDVDHPFMFPWNDVAGNPGVKSGIVAIIDQARAAVLYGFPEPVPPAPQPRRAA